MAHFQAHTEPIGHLQFNPSGHLLVTCDTSGHYFNVLEIQASPYRCTRTFVKHLYTLFRGDTDCRGKETHGLHSLLTMESFLSFTDDIHQR